MSDDLVIQADLDLFRRFLRVINTLQPTAPISHQAPLYRHEPLYRDPQWWLDDVEAAVESKDELFEEEDSEDELIEDDDEEEGVQGGGNEDQDEKDCDEDQESEEMNEEEEAETLDEDDDDDDNDELFDYYDEPKTASPSSIISPSRREQKQRSSLLEPRLQWEKIHHAEQFEAAHTRTIAGATRLPVSSVWCQLYSDDSAEQSYIKRELQQDTPALQWAD
ncbi:hypothetical protein BDW74DRAFT_177224 [Aspergillus multicolor]|uniref:uncharacterized protein n=1 Tax=Aspergillus multicolor TaxID=41759 RepID=UPI003CCCD3FB